MTEAKIATLVYRKRDGSMTLDVAEADPADKGQPMGAIVPTDDGPRFRRGGRRLGHSALHGDRVTDDTPRFVPFAETVTGRAVHALLWRRMLAQWIRNERRTLCEITGWPFDEGGPVHLREYPENAKP